MSKSKKIKKTVKQKSNTKTKVNKKQTKSKKKQKTKSKCSTLPLASHLKKNILPLAKKLQLTPVKTRKKMLTNMNLKDCMGVQEICCNVMRSPIIPVKTKNKLKKSLIPYKKDLRFITNNPTSNQTRDKLRRIGGLPLGAILSTAIPLIVSLIGK